MAINNLQFVILLCKFYLEPEKRRYMDKKNRTRVDAQLERGNFPQIMTLHEVAYYLGLHDLTIYRLIQEGKIPAAKVGGSWRFKKDVIDRWIEKDMDNHYHHTDEMSHGRPKP